MTSHTYIKVNGYHIKKKYISESKLLETINELNVSPKENIYTLDNPITYKIYTLTDNEIIVPRYYGVKKFGCPEKIFYNPEKCSFSFKGQLRDYQSSIVTKCYDYILKNGGGLISVPCGRGKTVMALQIASLLGYKTLVVVHKSFLIDQWIERGTQFTNAKFGIIRQNKVDVDDKDIVVATIQSISKHDYDPDIFKQFGFVIYDEAHHTPAKVFSRALSKTGSNYSLALSATPYRNDGLIKIMHWYIGETIYKETLLINSQVVAKIINYFSTNNLFEEKLQFLQGKMRPCPVKMITNLIHIPNRNDLITNIIISLAKEDRKILILSERIEHLEILKDKVDSLIDKNKVISNTRFYIGRLNQEERQEAEKNGDIFFASYNMAQEALDIERLNTIILVTPKKDVVQACGRILRKVLQDGDIKPLIIDIADELSIFCFHGKKRQYYYKRGNYLIESYNSVDSEIVTLNKYQNIVYGYNNTKNCNSIPIEDILFVSPVDFISDNDNIKQQQTKQPLTIDDLFHDDG